MIKPLQKFLLTVLLLLFAFSAFSQTGTLPGADDTKTKPDDKSTDVTSSFKFGVSYISNDVFMGRSDTVTTPMIVPEVKYSFKNGIYFSGALNFLPTKPKQKLDGGDVAAGYDLDITDDLSFGTSFTKLFYSASSTQIGSSISSTFNATFTYDIGTIVSPSVGFDYNINKGGINNDEFVTAGLSHDFIVEGVFGTTDLLLISPTATVNTGTQNFYDGYLNRKKYRSQVRTTRETELLNQYVNQLGNFELLDFELSVPIEYKSGHFIFQLIPTYAIVQNQIPLVIANKLSDAPGIFYVEAGASLKF